MHNRAFDDAEMIYGGQKFPNLSLVNREYASSGLLQPETPD